VDPDWELEGVSCSGIARSYSPGIRLLFFGSDCSERGTIALGATNTLYTDPRRGGGATVSVGSAADLGGSGSVGLAGALSQPIINLSSAPSVEFEAAGELAI
jgi:hypothetical protein